MTGGNGRLARALVVLDPSVDAPPRTRLDIRSYASIEAYCAGSSPAVMIHAAAITRFDEDANEYISTNIIGTANVVLWCRRHKIRLIYISSDYVYPGERGDYTEESSLLPVNHYARSKLGGEMAVQLYDNSLVIRTSFHETLDFARACTDQYTSRLPVDEAARAIYHLAVRTDMTGVVNVGASRKRTLYDIVKTEFNPRVEPVERSDFQLPYVLPPDSSVDTRRFQSALPRESSSRTVEACRSCGSKELTEYLNMGRTPLANSYLSEGRLGLPEFSEELALCLCRVCGLSQLSKVVDPDRMFREYLFVSSTTETFRRHCGELAERAISAAGAVPSDLVLDIASNDGCLLSAFQNRGMRVVGVDPAENLAREANARGIRTLCAYWSRSIAKDLAGRFGWPRIITATNVIAHVDDVHEFVAAVADCLAPRGIFVIECPYVVDLLEKNEFDTAYHEHLSYFGVDSLTRLVERHGFQVWDVAYFPDLHGGTIRVFVGRGRDYVMRPSVETFLERERAFGITDPARYTAFADRVVRNKKALVALIEDLNRADKRIWAYGASAKGNTLMNYCGISGEIVPVAIDDNAKKWGLYTAGSHMRIVGIDELARDRVDYLLLLAWNFEAEIRERCKRAGYTGGFIVPVPEPRIIESEKTA